MPRYLVTFQEEASVCPDLCDHGALFLRDILQSIYLGEGMEKNHTARPGFMSLLIWSNPGPQELCAKPKMQSSKQSKF